MKYDFKTRLDLARYILPKNATGCEIGVGSGDFSLTLYRETQPSHLFLIDRWLAMPGLDPSVYGWHCKHTQKDYDNFLQETKNKFQNHNNVTIIRNSSQEALKDFPDEYFDYLYLDASHDYESVKNDLELVRQKIKKDGFICGHDYNKNTNINFTGEYGVIEAVDEFVKNYGFNIDLTTEELSTRSYILYR